MEMMAGRGVMVLHQEGKGQEAAVGTGRSTGGHRENVETGQAIERVRADEKKARPGIRGKLIYPIARMRLLGVAQMSGLNRG